jgi:RNA polymerase sigma-70 factor (ECF subfamily)
MELSEPVLVQAIQTGNERAFEVVFKRYYGVLHQYAGSILRDDDEAEEIVQTMFAAIWEKRETFEISISLKSYLYRAVHNACLNRIKHLSVRSQHQAHTLYYSSEGDDSTHNKMAQSELSQEIEKAILKLPEQCRLIFRLSRFEELKYQEIADQLGLSIKTVENQIGKALKIMRVELSEFLSVLLLIGWQCLY